MTNIKSLIERLRSYEASAEFDTSDWVKAADALEALTDRLEAMEKELRDVALERTRMSCYFKALASMEAELAEERRKREEWVCRGCKKAFRAETVPDRPSCITCPDCGGDRMPKTMAEREDWKAKYDAARGGWAECLKEWDRAKNGNVAARSGFYLDAVDDAIATKLAEGKGV